MYSHIRKNALPPGGHLIQDIIGTNLLTKFHEDRKINVASRVLTRKNAPPPCGHVFQPTSIILKLVQDIIGMNLLTRKIMLRPLEAIWTINVASRVLTRQKLMTHDRQKAITKAHHEHIFTTYDAGTKAYLIANHE
ncbi:hypothetical protein DPMN_188772 [Dreissena polymorpha]|uniref:Uncharacterized protein n=1 Tax=Dreissena polymorpha TaxID=45954 RepID=A0A9D4DSS3_DREPO|nr:hypothetical protein DPMN_188772 [Dreissena polymorpha]